MRLIDADSISLKDIPMDMGGLVYIEDVLLKIEELPTVDAVPVNELLKLRDWLYESDGITMGGLRSLNELIAKYSNGQLPRIENGFERRNDD